MSVNMWTDELLAKLKNTGDDLADNTIKKIFENHEIEEANKFIVEMIKQEDIDLGGGYFMDVAEELHYYFEESGKPPEWANQERIKNAEKLFQKHGMIAFSLLGCASLPELYACGKGGTQVLGMTLELEAHIARRIFETAQWLVAVMHEGGLDPKRGNRTAGEGIRRTQKVRLMHAAVRYLILKDVSEEERLKPPRHFGDVLLKYKWGKRPGVENDSEEWGVPIGQEYMGATLQTFSYVIIRGLRQFGIEVTDQEANDFIHAWNVVGHYMGVDPIFLRNVNNMDEAKLLYDAVMRRNRSTTPFEKQEGVALTTALMNFLAGMIRRNAPLGKLLPTKLIPRLLTEELVGHDTAELLGVKLSFFQHLQLVPFKVQMWFMGLFSNITSTHQLAKWKFRLLAKALNNMPRGPHRQPFLIPDELMGAWKLEADK